ncbi:MAG: LptF/LptG family permease [Candidatus Didemnitutus sp.]|nr:LptF/LptG family permease [Candidatus Didemnitutus sp.]
MKLLHRHIFANVALTCLASVGLFAFVLMIGNALRDLLGYVLAGQLELLTFLRLIGLLVPFVISYALPMGVLTGVLLVLGRMSSDREITAIRASGVSVAGISAPIFFFALLGTGLSLLVNFQFMPAARTAYQQELAAAVRKNPLSFIVPKTFIRDFPGIVIYAGEKRGENTLLDFWIWEIDGQGRVKRFARAQSGRLIYDEEGNKLRLTVFNAQVEVRNERDLEDFVSESPQDPSMERATFDLPLDRVTGSRTVRTKLKWLTFAQLMSEWERLGRTDPQVPAEERARQRMKVQIVIQEKASMAFSVLSFALLAIPLGIKVSRKETSANLGLALALAMAYYFSTVVVGWFDNKPDLRPDLLMWMPNIVFQALGIWMFRKVDRQ